MSLCPPFGLLSIESADLGLTTGVGLARLLTHFATYESLENPPILNAEAVLHDLLRVRD